MESTANSTLGSLFSLTLLYDSVNPLTEYINTSLITRYSLFLIFTIVTIDYYLRRVVAKPELFCADTKFRRFLVNNIPKLNQLYWPPIWGFQTHIQTLLSNFLRGWLPNLIYYREVISTPDGGQVSLDWFAPESQKPNISDDSSPIALFLPGLVGDSQSEYFKSMVPVAYRLGYRAVSFNRRGRGGMKLLTPRFYCMSNCEDLQFTLEHLRKRNPNSKVIAIGVSMGGIILGRYLVETGDEAKVDAAFLVSVAWNVVAGAKSMTKPGLNYKMNKFLAKSFCDTIAENRPLLQSVSKINVNDVIRSHNLYEFDLNFTIKMWGFETVEQYYRDASLKGRLSAIKVPTLCLNAADDMFSPESELPIDEVLDNPNIALVLTKRGGHIGFMEGFLPILPFFIETLLHQYLDSINKLDNVSKELMP